jgi:hypothetical protein
MRIAIRETHEASHLIKLFEVEDLEERLKEVETIFPGVTFDILADGLEIWR